MLTRITKELTKDHFLSRLGVATVFLSHSLHGILTNNDVTDLGNLFLNKIGFAPFGVLIAWALVTCQVTTSVFLIVNRFIVVSCAINILILFAGIATVHWKEGWFVVGAGRNGIEFSFLLIIVLLDIALKTLKRDEVRT